MADHEGSFRDMPRELNERELAHIRAVLAMGDQMMGVLNSDSPDPYCQLKAKDRLRECVMWMRKAIELGGPI